MVQYIFTPWKDHRELLLVREQFYGHATLTVPSGMQGASRTLSSMLETGTGRTAPPSVDCDGPQRQQNLTQQQQQQQAVARVSMWMQRGNCPHLVESTALLTAAVLSDDRAATENAGASTYAIRAAYSAAFSRFVTGLLDSHQDKLRKQSMYSIAKLIGLPATYVELRHQATHEQLPSLAKLRPAAKNAIAWIWDYYWKDLPTVNPYDEGAKNAVATAEPEQTDPCRKELLAYLGSQDDARQKTLFEELRRNWKADRLLYTIAELQGVLPGNQAYLKCLRLTQEFVAAAERDRRHGVPILEQGGHSENSSHPLSITEAPKDGKEGGPNHESDSGDKGANASAAEVDDTGWTRYDETWKPKPIGIV